MAIFGVHAPKFVSGANTVLLDHVVVTKDEPDWRMLEHTAQIDQTREFSGKGYHWKLYLKMYLYKYANPSASYSTFMSYLFSEVTLYRHRENNPFQDADSNAVPFIIKEITPIYIERENGDVPADYKDGLLWKFESTKPIDITKSTS